MKNSATRGKRRTRQRKSRRMKKAQRTHCSKSINSLPMDLLIVVLSHVASNSFSDFFNAKLTCKTFVEAAKEEDCIYEKISMEKFPEIPWFVTEEVSEFLDKCRKRGNPEALYRQGMMDYFTHRKPESGIAFLKRAAEKRHADAIYTYGMILLCAGKEEEEEEEEGGKKMLERLKGSKDQIRLCRKRMRRFIWMMWADKVRGAVVRQNFGDRRRDPCNCFTGKGWERADENYDDCCETCFWEREIEWFCDMF